MQQYKTAVLSYSKYSKDEFRTDANQVVNKYLKGELNNIPRAFIQELHIWLIAKDLEAERQKAISQLKQNQ